MIEGELGAAEKYQLMVKGKDFSMSNKLDEVLEANSSNPSVSLDSESLSETVKINSA